MRNSYTSRFSTLLLVIAMLCMHQRSWGQVYGNNTSRGISVGGGSSRPSNSLANFSRYSTGSDSFSSISRTTPNPLDYRMKGSGVSPQAGLSGRAASGGVSNRLQLQSIGSPLRSAPVSQSFSQLMSGPLSHNINYGGYANNVPPFRPMGAGSNAFYRQLMSGSPTLPSYTNGPGFGGSPFSNSLLTRQSSLSSSSPLSSRMGLGSNVSLSQRQSQLTRPGLAEIGGLTGNSVISQRGGSGLTRGGFTH